jgi:hypothetical protein
MRSGEEEEDEKEGGGSKRKTGEGTGRGWEEEEEEEEQQQQQHQRTAGPAAAEGVLVESLPTPPRVKRKPPHARTQHHATIIYERSMSRTLSKSCSTCQADASSRSRLVAPDLDLNP